MRRFIKKVGIFGLPVLIFILCFYHFADGFTDPFYLRFTTSKQNSLVLGTSRAAQGIVPRVLNKALNRKDFYNYSFTIAHSPYGEIYLKSIKRKLKQESNNGLFILTIDPWSVSSEFDGDKEIFHEKNRFLNDMYFVNNRPNYYYLLRHYNQKNYKIIENKKNSKTFLDKDGWLKVNIKWKRKVAAERLMSKLKEYEESFEYRKISKKRIFYLLDLIKYLKNHGKVFLVRLPIDPKLLTLENKYAPEFSKHISAAIDISDGYFDMTPFAHEYKYTDGNHLFKTESLKVTERISQWIKMQINNKIKQEIL